MIGPRVFVRLDEIDARARDSIAQLDPHDQVGAVRFLLRGVPISVAVNLEHAAAPRVLELPGFRIPRDELDAGQPAGRADDGRT